MADSHRPDRGELPVGIVSMCGLRTSSNDNETRVILEDKEWGNRARLMYKLGSVRTSYKHVYNH